jgi:hypothetical protein
MNEKSLADRKEALRFYIGIFADEMKKHESPQLIIDIDAAADHIGDLYDRYVEEVMRPVVKSGIIQNYKIISFTELTVMRVQPVDVVDGDELQIAWYNAKLATHIAIAFLLEWNNIDSGRFKELIEKDGQLSIFINEHTTWLADLDNRFYFPGFSNSQIWRLFHYLVQDRIQKL